MLTKRRSCILLIEDSRLESRLISDMLGEQGGKGFLLKTTETLTEGKELLKGSKIDLILLDLNLPDSQGIETLSTLISCEKKIPVVVISALEDEVIALEALAKGACDYLLKGHFDGKVLIRSIHYSMERKRIEEELRKAYKQLEKKVDKRTEELQKINQKLAAEIVERKEIEKKLKESAEQYIGLFENSIEAVFTASLKGIFTQINKAFELISGYDRDEVIGQDYRKVMTTETAEKVFKAYNRLYLTGDPITDLTYDFIRKDGQKRTVEGYVNVVRREDKIVGFQGTLRDITERDHSVEALRESEERFRNLFENSIQAILTVDLRGTITSANQAFSAMSGYTVDELVGMSYRELIIKEDAQRMYEAYNRLYSTGEPIRDMISSRVHKNGEIRISQSYVNVIRKQGEIVGFQTTIIDITDRMRGEEAIRESEERFRNLFENSIEAVLTADLGGTITSANHALSEMSGYTIEELVGKNYRELMSQEEAQTIYEAYNRLYRTGEPIRDLVSSMIHRAGEKRTAQSYVNVIRKGNETVGFQATIRDITEKQHIVDALIESEQRLKLAVDAAKIGLWDYDFASGRVLRSGWWFEMLGYSEKDIEPTIEAWVKLIHPDDLLIPDQVFDEHVEGKIPFYQVEFRMKGASGDYHWILDRGQVVSWDDTGKPVRAVGTHIDITERKRAEEALRLSEEKYRQVIENAQESIVIFADGVIQYANPITEKLTGYTQEELKSKSLAELVHPENHEGLMKEYFRKLSGDPLTYPSEFRYIAKDGKLRWYEGVGVPITWEGKPALLSFSRDITDRKNLEGQLLQSQKMEAIGAMAGGIAHNFNNILVGIMGYSEYLLSKRGEDDPEYKALKTIFDGTVKASQLTRQLLNVTRAGEYQLRRYDINTVVDKVLPLIMGTFDKSIEIRTNLGTNLPPFNADSVHLEQCLLNLCINARDAMPSGGSLIIETCEKDLDDYFVRTHIGSQTGKHLVLTVNDTGIGMSQEVQDRIFEPFFTTKAEQEGTGMGLATVYGTVKKHGGFITVYSEQGEGTTFRLYFPVTRETTVESQSPETIQEKRGNETILIIDDEQVVRELWAEYLRNIGYDVIMAENGEEGISLLLDRKNTVDLIILDVIMPKMGGKETLKRIKEVDPHAKILIASGYSEEGKAGEMIVDNVEGFIQKPTTLTELSEKIRIVLDSMGS